MPSGAVLEQKEKFLSTMKNDIIKFGKSRWLYFEMAYVFAALKKLNRIENQNEDAREYLYKKQSMGTIK